MLLQFFKQRIFSRRLKTYLITTFMLTIIFITLLLSTICYNYASKMLLSQSEQAILRSLKQLEYNINQTLDNLNNISRQVLVSAYFDQGMNIDSLSSPENVREVNEIYSYFSALIMNYDYIDSLFYYNDSGTIIGLGSTDRIFRNDPEKINFFYQSDLYETVSADKNVALSGAFTSMDFFNSSKARKNPIHYITMARSIKSMGHSTGFIIINMKEAYLRSLYHNDNINSEGDSFLLDQYDVIISAEDKSLISTKVTVQRNEEDYSAKFYAEGIDNEAHIKNNQIISYTFDEYKLSILYEIPYAVLFRDIKQLKQIIEYLVILSILASLVISIFWIYKITRPLENLVQAMNTMGQGSIGLKLNENVRSELGILGKQFNRMSANIVELMEENRNIQEERHKLELQNLQNQISPHFLYNTLNTIKWMAIVSKADNISTCITALGNMLKPIYSSKASNWTFTDEVSYLRNYICIMNYRTGNSIDFIVNVPEDILEYCIPKFILQPLIENSMIHSNPFNNIKNRITLDAAGHGEYVTIRITDIGVGIPPARLARIQNHLQDDPILPSFSSSQAEEQEAPIGIGLINTDKRIKLLYGKECGLTICSAPGKGTVVIIKLKINPSLI